MSESAEYPIGALSQYLLSPTSKVVVLPDLLDLLTAARLGYIGTSFGGLKKGNVGPGTTLLVNGATGTLGLAAVAIALGFGAVKIIGIERNKERLAKLEEMSPIKGRIVTRSSEDEDDLVEWVKERTGGVGVDALYDCLGVGGQANTTQDLRESRALYICSQTRSHPPLSLFLIFVSRPLFPFLRRGGEQGKCLRARTAK
jgi:alcohol dehydrogenase